MTAAFTAIDLASDFALDLDTSPAGPIQLRSFRGGFLETPRGGSVVVLPIAPTVAQWPGASAVLSRGCYALVPGGASVEGRGLLIQTPAYVGLVQTGGPVEALGRLRYIDGCSDSLLICPAQLGEPCLNLLHLPAGIHQTAHTHPSVRIGIVLRGGGVCRTPDGETWLTPGLGWVIPPDGVHSFHTGDDQSLDVLAWHPDSDFGPSHDAHPMLNRTIVEGVSATDPRHAGIRTVLPPLGS